MALTKVVRDQSGFGEGTCLTVRVEGNEVILRKAAPGSWREWEGRFKGSDLLGDLDRERSTPHQVRVATREKNPK